MGRKITAIQIQKRNRQRVNLFLDGEFAFGLSRIVAAWLEVGQELSEDKIASLQNEDSHEAAYQQALKFIDVRSRAEAEVRRNLVEHGITPEVIDEVLERLRRAGMVDDARFAQNWVENRREFRPRGRRALAQELRQRGLEDEAIAGALEAFDDEGSAYQAAVNQSRKLKSLEWLDFRQKLSSFLARRGFSYEVILPTVKRVWEEIHSGGRDDGN
jgi:regulatory protein